MKKVLFVAHVDSHIRHFHLPYLKYFKDNGYEVHVATSNDENEIFPNCDFKHTIQFERNPIKFNNIKAIKRMKELLNKEHFELVHCNTPIGGAVTRLACKKAIQNGTKILYTAHGFHFYSGAPLINWIIYYPIEKILSKRTDVLVTINHEDFELASKKFYAKKVELIHGVGVDDKKFNSVPLSSDKMDSLKKELNINEDDFVIMYVAELNQNKNQIMLINAMKKITSINPRVKLFLIGDGISYDFYLQKIKKLDLEKNIKLLGYRRDVCNLLKTANLYVSTSIREGLGLNLIEAALCGIPLLASKNRGHYEIIQEEVNGYFFSNEEELINKIKELTFDKEKLKTLSNRAQESVQKFTLKNAYEEQISIYRSILE